MVENLRKSGKAEEKIAEIVKILERLDFYKFVSVKLDRNLIYVIK